MHPIVNLRFLPVFTLLAMLSACGARPEPDEKTASGKNPAPDTVPVFLLRTDTVQKTVELPGELSPYQQTDLYSKVPGFVQAMKVDIGDKVRKGQTLAVIEAPELNTRFAEAESSTQAAKAKWIAGKDHYDRLLRASQNPSPGIVAPVELERARNEMMADSASYEAARQQATAYKQVSGYLTITAPFDGVITARKADPGALVGTQAMLLTVQQNSTLRLRVAVPEIYVASAGSIRRIQFSVDAYPEQAFSGILTRKAETVDPATRTELWEFGIDNSTHLLKAGVFAVAKIGIRRNASSFTVPPSAIATTLERKFVIKVTQGKAEWIDVRQGITTDAGIEIFGNLQKGDTLVVKSTDERKPGSIAYWKLDSRSLK